MELARKSGRKLTYLEAREVERLMAKYSAYIEKARVGAEFWHIRKYEAGWSHARVAAEAMKLEGKEITTRHVEYLAGLLKWRFAPLEPTEGKSNVAQQIGQRLTALEDRFDVLHSKVELIASEMGVDFGDGIEDADVT